MRELDRQWHGAPDRGVERRSAALERLRNETIDCVVVDLLLPDMSGFDLIEQIRSENEHLPIIVYTGEGPLARRRRRS